jgi:hypothetical protein
MPTKTSALALRVAMLGSFVCLSILLLVAGGCGATTKHPDAQQAIITTSKPLSPEEITLTEEIHALEEQKKAAAKEGNIVDLINKEISNKQKILQELQEQVPVIEPKNAYGISENATGVDYERLADAHQLEAVESYLDSRMGGINGKNINPHVLDAAAKQFISKGNLTDELTKIFSEAISEIEAKKQAQEDAISERKEAYRRHLLEARVAVGKTGPEVEQLLGQPESHQEIGGEKLWYYRVADPKQGSEEWQLIFSGTNVVSENQY